MHETSWEPLIVQCVIKQWILGVESAPLLLRFIFNIGELSSHNPFCDADS